MRRISNGKAYDTATAKSLGEASSRLFTTDFGYWTEALYRTKSGSFFLSGSGGPLTSWAEHYGNSSSGGSGIRPLSTSQAHEWAERYLTAAEYEAIFTAEEA